MQDKVACYIRERKFTLLKIFHNIDSFLCYTLNRNITLEVRFCEKNSFYAFTGIYYELCKL